MVNIIKNLSSTNPRNLLRGVLFALVAVATTGCEGCGPADPPSFSQTCTAASDCSDGLVCWAGTCQEAPGHDGPSSVTIPDAGPEDLGASDAGPTPVTGGTDAGSPSAGADGGSLPGDSFSDGGTDWDSSDGGLGDGQGEASDAGVPQEQGCTADFHCFGYVPCGNDPTCFSPVRCHYFSNVCVLNDCIDDNDCTEGYLCSAGHCVYAGCRDNFDCNFGFEVCDLETRECVATQAVGCTQNRDCDELVEHCDLETGTCLPGRRCAWDANCGSNQACGAAGFCEPLRECVTTLNCALDEVCLGAAGGGIGGFCREENVFCSNNSHCVENQHCDIFSGKCVRSGSCGDDDDYCGIGTGHACSPVGNSGSGSCVFANVPCSTDLNCLSYETCRHVWPGKEAGGPKRCVPKDSCIVDPNLCLPDQTCTSDGHCIDPITDEVCESDGDCEENGFVNFICAREGNDSSVGVCVERAGAGECFQSSDCLNEEVCVVETGNCLADPTINEPTDCSPEAGGPAVCGTPSGCPDNGGACVCNTDTDLCVDLAGDGDCSADTDCLDDEVCDTVARVCKEFAELFGGDCDSDSDCEAGFTCDLDENEGTCVLLATAGCSGDADCAGQGETCNTDLIPSRCELLDDLPCGTDQECVEALGSNALCNIFPEGGTACVVLAGGACCTGDSGLSGDSSLCRADEVCTASSSEDCAFVCQPLNLQGCETNADCVCDNCAEQEVCDLTQPGLGGQGGTCVRISGGDQGSCETTDDCRFGEACVIGEAGERYCVDEGTTVDCSQDVSVCAEGAEVCANVCEGDDCSWTCVLVQGGGGCKSTDDCRTGEACVLPDGIPCGPDDGNCGTCENLYGCDENADCGEDAACDTEVGECYLLGTACDVASGGPGACGANEVCDEAEGLCKISGGPCGQDGDCPGIDGYCDLNLGVCRLGAPCTDNLDCDYDSLTNPSGTVCDFGLGACRSQTPECYVDANCIGGQICCTDVGEGCALNKCYFRTPSCVDWSTGGLLEGQNGADVCDGYAAGCNSLTGHCGECDLANDACGLDYCQVTLGICVDFEQ